MRLLIESLPDSLSGALLSTKDADHIAVDQGAPPERKVAIACHEVAHALLGHDHHGSVGSSLVDFGLLRGLSPELIKSVIAGRQAFASTVEAGAELVATHLSVQLRKRVMRGGNTHFDDRWH